MQLRHRNWSPARALLAVALLVCVTAAGDRARAPVVVLAATPAPEIPPARPGDGAAFPSWNVKTHVFAANIVLGEVQATGKVTIPPFGEFAVNAELVKALKLHPDDYRSGVVGPDVFPDIFVGQSFAHVDHWCDHNHWIADYWMRQAFDAARSSTDPEDLRLRRLAFAYGFLTHGAQDMIGHTFINHYVGAKWGSFTSAESVQVDLKHVVLEAYVAKHTPPSDLTLNVDDRFQAEHLIKPADIRAHTLDAPHYQSFLRMYTWLGSAIDQTYNALGRDTSSQHCYLTSVNTFKSCEELFYMIGWRKDIDRGLRHLIDANKQLGDALLAGSVSPGIDALMDWTNDWLPKMYGLHAIGEFDLAMQEFGDWWKSVNPLQPIDSIINKAVMTEVETFLKHNFSQEYAYFQMVMHPASDLDQLFARSKVDSIHADMHMVPGPDSLVNWGAFDALYNTVIASRLVLLDGDGLNDLARRAGLTTPLYGPGPMSNIMIGVMRSMDGDHQWDSVSVDGNASSPRRHYGLPLSRPKGGVPTALVSSGLARAPQQAGQQQRGGGPHTDCGGTQTPPEYFDSTGYAYFQATGAREKIFQFIFRGWGPPGAPLPPPVGIRPPPGIVLKAPTYDALTRDLDTLQREVAALAQRKQMALAIAPAQIAVLQHPPRGTVPHWGRICCGASVQAVRSALTDFASDARGAARSARRSGDARAAQIIAQMLTQASAADTQAGNLLVASDATAAQDAIQQLNATVATLTTLVAQVKR